MQPDSVPSGGTSIIEYYDSLPLNARNRYDEKIAIIKRDPYKIPAKEFGKDINNWPEVTYYDVVNYLMFNISAYTKEQFRRLKSMEAFRLSQDGWVKDILHLKLEGYHLLRSKVYHSMKIREKPVEPWVIANDDGTILSAHCTYMAGLGEGCSHIGAVLFSLHTGIKIRNEASVTDVPAYWLMPSTASFETPYKQVKDIEFCSATKKRKKLNDDIAGLDDSSHSDKSTAMCEISSPTKSEIDNFFVELRRAVPRAAVLSLTDKFSKDFEPKTLSIPKPLCLVELYTAKLENSSYEDLIKHCDQICLTVTPEQVKIVEKATRKQSNSKLWYQMRAGRITASILYDVCHTSIEKPSMTVLKKICTQAPFNFFSKATDYGEKKERKAKQDYVEFACKIHTNFECTESGLILSSEIPFLGASPDAFVHCDCCGEGCVEIKCPYTLRDSTSPLIDWMVKKDDNSFALSETSKHYYQVQMQLFVTDRQYCNFIVWSPNFLHVEKIDKNLNFWLSKLEKAKMFHAKCIMPELCAKFFSKKTVNPENMYCICQGTDDGSKMIMCEKGKLP